jgi:hypothetical protein
MEDSYRIFNEISDEVVEGLPPSIVRNTNSTDLKNKVEKISHDIIGHYSKFTGPFGEKPLCYADWTASGRSVNSIENYVFENVMTQYGNTHTTTSITGNFISFNI